MTTAGSDMQFGALELLIEVTPDEACFGHIPALPGLCFKADNPDELYQKASNEVLKYLGWLIQEGILNTIPAATKLAKRIHSGSETDIQLVEKERAKGAPLWISGNPAVLFEADKRTLDNNEVNAHLRFVKQAVTRIKAMISNLTPERRQHKPAEDRRSIDETLRHIGNCVWWYCSRIDDRLTEPKEYPDEDPIRRIERFLKHASEFLLAVPFGKRPEIYIPKRFTTSDPNEQWNHTKVCRRQAEHVWEHLQAFETVMSDT
jgi:hypothetical protein